MSSYNSESSERWHLFRKVFLLLLLVVALALGLVILFRQKSGIPLLLFNILADVSLGLAAGLGARFVLGRRNWFIQAAASAAISLIGLGVLGYFTNWKSGIGPLQLEMVKVNWLSWAHIALRLPLKIGRSHMELVDLAHMVIALDTSWISLRAWKRSSSVVSEVAYAPAVRSRGRARAVRAVASSPGTASFPRVRVPVAAGSNGRAKVKRKKSSGRPMISRPTMADVKPARTRTKSWNPLHRKPEVQLAVYEEHRCPYCLEIVKRDDPGGVVECEVCHALHHKDCWDITGTCQVPHLNV